MNNRVTKPMKDSPKSSRRKVLKTVGVATVGLAATVPASGRKVADQSKEVSPQLHEGQRVTDGNDDGIVSVYNQPDTDTYDQMVDGGKYNDPFGTTQSGEVYDSESDETFIEVSWDSGVTGWSIIGGLAPVNTY